MVVVITLFKVVVVCPPGASLVIKIVVLDNIVEPPAVGLESKEVLATSGLVNWLDDTTGPDDKSVV